MQPEHRNLTELPARALNDRMSNDALLLFRSWLTDPLRTGAQLPSGPWLGRAMADALGDIGPGAVVELGPGTGAVSDELIARGIAPSRLILIEYNPDFIPLLKARYPQARVINGDAYNAPRLLQALNVGPIAAIVSGLPLMARSPRARLRLVKTCLRFAEPNAPFVQFTYFYRSPLPTADARLIAEASPMVWFNVWPARVWTYRLAPKGAQESDLKNAIGFRRRKI